MVKIILILAVFSTMMTVPDCVVMGSNKLGKGHGEAKFYIGSKKQMYEFYGSEKFKARCFLLKKDLISYLQAIKNEYLEPSQDYNKKEEFPKLWEERLNLVNNLDEIIFFEIEDQIKLKGKRIH